MTVNAFKEMVEYFDAIFTAKVKKTNFQTECKKYIKEKSLSDIFFESLGQKIRGEVSVSVVYF